MLICLIFLRITMAQIDVECIKCGSTKTRKHGFAPNGIQRYWCRGCQRVFQLDFVNQGSQPDIHERIVKLTMEGMGFRAIARTLQLSLPTVSKHLKKIKAENRAPIDRKREKPPSSITTR